MGFILKTDGLLSYSRKEQGLFALLPKGGKKVTSTQLVEKFYGRRKPFHARKIVIGAMTSLLRKVEKNKEPFRVKRTARSGPIPIEYWIERR